MINHGWLTSRISISLVTEQCNKFDKSICYVSNHLCCAEVTWIPFQKLCDVHILHIQMEIIWDQAFLFGGSAYLVLPTYFDSSI